MIRPSGIQTIVDEEILFFHHDTVNEAVGVSDQFEEIVAKQREFIETRSGGLRAKDKEWLIEVVTAHTNAEILPKMKLTWSAWD